MKWQLLIRRRETLFFAAIFASVFLLPGVAMPDEAASPVRLTRESALKQLQKPGNPARYPRGAVIATPSGLTNEFFPFTERIGYWVHGRRDAFLFLSEVSDLDAELDALTKSDQPLEVQFRGIYLLLQRCSPEGARLAAAWMRSDDRMLRYAAWYAVGNCPNPDVVWKVLSPKLALGLYRVESDSYVEEEIVEVFGRHKARFAVDALCRTLARPKNDIMRDRATWALGQIGDARAIETLTRAPYISGDIIEALGLIGDVKGANCVIEHMNRPGATLAILRIGGPKALPALERELDHVRFQKEVDDGRKPGEDKTRDNHEAELELAISIVKEPDPQKAWIAIAESRENRANYRSSAFEELQRIGVSRVRTRFLALYRRVMTSEDENLDHGRPTVYSDMNWRCIPIAEADMSDETTVALKENLSILSKPFVLPAAISPSSQAAYIKHALHEVHMSMVMHALQKRIGNDVFALRDKFSAQHSADAAKTSP